MYRFLKERISPASSRLDWECWVRDRDDVKRSRSDGPDLYKSVHFEQASGRRVLFRATLSGYCHILSGCLKKKKHNPATSLVSK